MRLLGGDKNTYGAEMIPMMMMMMMMMMRMMMRMMMIVLTVMTIATMTPVVVTLQKESSCGLAYPRNGSILRKKVKTIAKCNKFI